MKLSFPETEDSSVPCFDLHGSPTPASLSPALPSHLGLHHHAEGSRAGYIIDNIFLLIDCSCSAGFDAWNPSQISRQGQQVRHLENSSDEAVVFAGQEGEP